MTSRRVEPLAAAFRDFDGIVDYYLAEAEEGAAERFVDAVEAAYRLISRAPGGGSSQLGAACGFPDLRSWNLRGFPYLVFYVEHPNRIDIVRILHGQRDLPTELAEPWN